MALAPSPEPGVVYQAVYTWAGRTLQGRSGLGIVAASPGLRNHVDWLEHVARRPLNFNVDESRRNRSTPESHANFKAPGRTRVEGNLAICYMKRGCPDTDASGRPRFSAHVLVAAPETLSAERVFRIEDRFWLGCSLNDAETELEDLLARDIPTARPHSEVCSSKADDAVLELFSRCEPTDIAYDMISRKSFVKGDIALVRALLGVLPVETALTADVDASFDGVAAVFDISFSNVPIDYSAMMEALEGSCKIQGIRAAVAASDPAPGDFQAVVHAALNSDLSGPALLARLEELSRIEPGPHPSTVVPALDLAQDFLRGVGATSWALHHDSLDDAKSLVLATEALRARINPYFLNDDDFLRFCWSDVQDLSTAEAWCLLLEKISAQTRIVAWKRTGLAVLAYSLGGVDLSEGDVELTDRAVREEQLERLLAWHAESPTGDSGLATLLNAGLVGGDEAIDTAGRWFAENQDFLYGRLLRPDLLDRPVRELLLFHDLPGFLEWSNVEPTFVDIIAESLERQGKLPQWRRGLRRLLHRDDEVVLKFRIRRSASQGDR